MNDQPQQPTAPASIRPSRRWYALSLLLMLGSIGLFVAVLVSQSQRMRERLEPMPRFVGPTDDAGFVVTVDKPGKINLFYENKGDLGGRAFDTHRRQIWTTFDTPSMTCVVTRADSGQTVEVRLPGVGEVVDKRVATRDLVIAYDVAGRQGHSAWVFDADEAGDYRIVLKYKDSVSLEPGEVVIPPELSKADKKQMQSQAGKAYEESRRQAVEQAALAELEPVEVLFAVGPDPTAGGFFQLIGLKGAATILAFGFTFSVLIALVTLMLRSGHVTERGEMSAVRRLGEQAAE